MRALGLVISLVAAIVSGPGPVGAFTITTFGPGAFNADTAAMDATFGLTGMSIETFSDTTLIPRLSIEFQNPDGGPLTTLPTTFSFAGGAASWDGDPILINRPTNTNVQPFSDTIFHIAGGTSRFGIGLADFQTVINETDLIVNGTNLGRVHLLPDYADGSSRNLYLIIAAESGDPLITSVEFDNLIVSPTFTDAHLFDHVAIDPAAPPVPVASPGSLALVGIGLAGAAALRRRVRP